MPRTYFFIPQTPLHGTNEAVERFAVPIEATNIREACDKMIDTGLMKMGQTCRVFSGVPLDNLTLQESEGIRLLP